MISLIETQILIGEFLFGSVTADVFWMRKINEAFERGKTEMSKLYMDAVIAGGYDISPCMVCGTSVVCIPDGLPMCETCAMKEAKDNG